MRKNSFNRYIQLRAVIIFAFTIVCFSGWTLDSRTYNLNVKVSPALTGLLSDQKNLSNPLDLQFELLDANGASVMQKTAEKKSVSAIFEGLNSGLIYQIRLSPSLKSGVQLRSTFQIEGDGEKTVLVDERSTVVAFVYDALSISGSKKLSEVDSGRNQAIINELSSDLSQVIITSDDGTAASEFYSKLDVYVKKIITVESASVPPSSNRKNQSGSGTQDNTDQSGVEFTSKDGKDSKTTSNSSDQPTEGQLNTQTTNSEQTQTNSGTEQTSSAQETSQGETTEGSKTETTAGTDTAVSETTVSDTAVSATTSTGVETTTSNDTGTSLTTDAAQASATSEVASSTESVSSDPVSTETQTSATSTDTKPNGVLDEYDVAKMSGANMVMLPETFSRLCNLNIQVRIYSRNIGEYEGEIPLSSTDGETIYLRKVPELSNNDKITFLVDKFQIKMLKPVDRISFSAPLPSGTKVELYDKDERKTLAIVSVP
ncbi:MAG: hypothetical protein HQM10_13840 [Candidatus Riflebacteria bacterium]|nr:hypothetical protein [Candidatus Riflebacteria bacterium]